MPSFKEIRDDVIKLADAGAQTSDINEYLSARGYTPQEFAQANENFGTFTSAVKRGGKGIGMLLGDIAPAMAGYLGEKLGISGAKEYKERQMAEAATTQQEMEKLLPTEYESFEDIKSARDVPGYALEALGEGLPSLIPSILTGGTASLVGRGAVMTAGKIAADQAKKQALRTATAEELVSGLASQQATAAGTRAATQAMARKQLQQEAVGAFAGSAALNVPEAFQSIYSETGQMELLPAIAAGGFNAILDAITPISLLRSAKGKGLTNEAIIGEWYKRGAKELGKGFLTEGATESIQEMSNAAAVKFVDANKDFFTPENLVRFIDAGLKGGVAGGGIQGGFGVAFGKKPEAEQAPLPPTQGPGPLTPAQAGATPTTAEPLQTPLRTTSEAGPIPAAQRDLFGGVVPGTQLETPTEGMQPVIGPDGKVTGYAPAPAPRVKPELTGDQAGLQFGGQQELFEGAAPAQPAQTPPEALPEATPTKPINEAVQEVVAAAKQDPTASKILKGNNVASARIVADRIQALLPTPDADPVEAMERLYLEDKTGKYPAGTKALSDAQRELLETTYRRLTGRDIEDAIKERAFMGAQQAELFGGPDGTTQGGTQPVAGTTPADVGMPTGGLGAPGEPTAPTGVGVAGGEPTVGGPAGGAVTPPVAVNPEEAWDAHKNDDHPAYTDLGPEEKAAWDKLVGSGRGNAVNFQDIVQAQTERVRRESVRTPEEIAEATKRHKQDMGMDMESMLKGKSFEEALKIASTVGPEANREIIRKMIQRVKELKRAGYRFTFAIADTPARVKSIGGFSSSGVAGRVVPDFAGKHMNIALAGRNSGQSYGGDLETFTHEGLHAITCALVELGQTSRGTEAHKIVKDLDALYKHIYKYLENKFNSDPDSMTTFEKEAWYGYNNALGNKPPSGKRYNQLHEIVSWTMTNGNMMRTMESIPYKGKSVFSHFVEAVRKLLGLSTKSDTALSELLRLTERLLEAPTSEISQTRGLSTKPFTSINSDAFRKWFGNSKVVDENGNPLVVYHGTTAFDGNEFKPSKKVNRANNIDGYYFTSDSDEASGYSLGTDREAIIEGAQVIPAYLSLQNPFVAGSKVTPEMLRVFREELRKDNPNLSDSWIDSKVEIMRERGAEGRRYAPGIFPNINFPTAAMQRVIEAGGYDGFQDGGRHWIAFKPNQIKSAIGNIGTYGAGPSILESSRTPWSERETPNQFGREESLTRMVKRMQEVYDESFSPDEAFAAAYENATREEQYILRQLKQDGMLGFDYPHQAIQAIIQEPTAYDLAPQLKVAISKLGNKVADFTDSIPLDAQYDAQVEDTPIPIPPGTGNIPAPGQPYPWKRATKLQQPQSTTQQAKNVAQKITDSWNSDDFWTKFRIAAVDPTAGLAKTLSSLPVFQNGQLRADMLIRSFNQVINLIKNGLQSGIPVINDDGTVIIQQSEDNMARSVKLADELDSDPIVKGAGFTGRGYVGEIARILRGEEIMAEDARLRAKAAKMLAEAKQKMAEAKYLRGTNAPMTEIVKRVTEAKALRREASKFKNINREKQITADQITWAKQQLQAVPQVQEVLDIWRAVNMSLIDLWENAGLLTAREAANYRQKTSYVPLYAAREDLAAEKQEAYTGQRTGTKTVRLLDHLEGADIQRNIWENMDKHYASMVAAAYQNQTRRIAVDQLRALGAAKISTTSDNDKINLRYKDPSNPNADNNGVVHVILDNPNDLAAFQMMHYELGPLMKGLSATTQVLRAGALINPMYWLKQLIRDPIHASVVAQSGIITPFHAAKEYINILANNSEEARLLASRGVIGQVDSTIDLADYLKNVGTEKINPSMLDKMMHKVMQMHEASDAATRVSIFKKAKADGLSQGMSEKEATDYAVFRAREAINFAVRGNSKTLNALRHMIPFFSAAITSLDTMYRAATGYGLNPAEKKKAQELFRKRAAMMVVLSTAYAMMLQDDDDYKKLPDNVKDNNWLFPNPFGGGHSFIKIPVPFEVGFLFKTIPEAGIRYMAGTSTGKEVLASYASGLQRNLPGEGILIPQAAKPALEAITNYSFFTKRPIEGMSDQGLPVAMRGPNATEISKILSKYGLDSIGLSPAKLDHLIQGYMAELGTFTTGTASAAIAAATGKESPAKNIEQMPFFKSFMTNPNTSKAATDFYDIMHNAQETVNAFNRMKKEGRVQEAKEFMDSEEKRKLVAIAPTMRKIQDNMAKIRARVNQIEASKGMDPETKRVQINKLMDMYDKVAQQGYRISEKAGISR